MSKFSSRGDLRLRAFDNNYWPAVYLIDGRGQIRYHQFGEGDYERSERRRAHSRRGGIRPGRQCGRISRLGLTRSSENYVGYDRSVGFSSPAGLIGDRIKGYSHPARFAQDTWALSGKWTTRNDRPTPDGDHGTTAYNFHARDLQLVMGSRNSGLGISLRVLIDGRVPGSAHGAMSIRSVTESLSSACIS